VRRQFRPTVDGLENKTLLSQVAASFAAQRVVIEHDARLVETGSMAVSLTTNQPVYRPGQVVAMKLTMTNMSNGNKTILLGPSVDGLSLTHNGKVIWRSNDGVVPEYIARRIVKPGQSITLTAHWTATRAAGTYVVHNQMYPTLAAARFDVFTSPTPVSPTPVSPIPSPPPIAY